MNRPIIKFIVILLFLIIIFPLLMTSSEELKTDKKFEGNDVRIFKTKGIYSKFPVTPGSILAGNHSQYYGNVSVLLQFSYSNQSRLNSLLQNLSDQKSAQYRHFLNLKEFDENFSPPSYIYCEAVQYFSNFPHMHIKKFSGMFSLQICGSSLEMSKAFNTSFVVGPSEKYYSTNYPELPESIASHISGSVGFTDRSVNASLNLGVSGKTYKNVKQESGYPSPIDCSNGQLIYGSDLQVAYDEVSLFNFTYPKNEVIATILWSGQNKTGANVGPYDPTDVYDYFNETLPKNEPMPQVHAVPINGAPYPGIRATCDVTGSFEENTLDLEMAGSLAPGASIFNVYGPTSSCENIDSAFAFILNPNNKVPQLKNVSVITNSWGASDNNNTLWYDYLQEAQARGITVLASSGDGCDNVNSSKYSGSISSFPAAMAYNSFGITAVGGTTLRLYQDLSIENQTAWYISSDCKLGPIGSEGGISTVFPEPAFQLSTEANKILGGKGRGTPDISAIANDTAVCLSVNLSNPAPYIFYGTSIASPVMAGIIAEIDAVLKDFGEGNVGYLNPFLYKLANRQFYSNNSEKCSHFISSGGYKYGIPASAFYNVDSGHNHLFKALPGYNLVTGWGSINAYNLTLFLIERNFSFNPSALRGVDFNLSLQGINVTGYLYNNRTGSFSSVDNCYNGSIQENAVVANELGAPLYWIQNVIYLKYRSGFWFLNYTAWVSYPFFGLYPGITSFRYLFPIGKMVSLPHEFNMSMVLENSTSPCGSYINFVVNNNVEKINTPGAAYIIGSQNYNYIYNGKNEINGPSPGTSLPGGLAPQFGLTGPPTDGLGKYGNGTVGNVTSYGLYFSSHKWVALSLHPISSKYSIVQTGETASGIVYSGSGNRYSLSFSRNADYQGVFASVGKVFCITIRERGLPDNTPWYVKTNGTPVILTTANNTTFPFFNGTFTFCIMSSNPWYSGGNLTVNVKNNLSYTWNFQRLYLLSFEIENLPLNGKWGVNISSFHDITELKSISLKVKNGTYNATLYHVTGTVLCYPGGKIYNVENSQIQITVDGHNETFTLDFGLNSSSGGNIIILVLFPAALILVIAFIILLMRKRKDR
ncbi:S53 family peptidase [Caldiplasma sukawensis]